MPLGPVLDAGRHSVSATTLSTGAIVLVSANRESTAINPFPICSTADATTKLALIAYLSSEGILQNSTKETYCSM